MAIVGGARIRVEYGDVFPHGCMAVGVERAMDYDAETKTRSEGFDKRGGEPVWNVSVIDLDPDARAREKTVVVKVTAQVQPVLPPEIVPGTGLRPVIFENLTVTPYVNGSSRLAYSLRATGVREAKVTPAAAAAASVA